MRPVTLAVVAIQAFATSFGGTFAAPDADDRPQTWFHVIGGNLSKAGLTADLEAIRAAGLGGIQFFHGQVGKAFAWPRTQGQIPCLSAKWDDHVAYLADECARLGLKFEMQNCPGWSMSGGPWVTPEKAMRQLVAFARDCRPAFDADDDYREIGEVSFPQPAGWGLPEPVAQSVTTNGATRVFTFAAPVTLRQLILPPSRDFTHDWVYESFLRVRFEAETAAGWRVLVDRPFPRGCWQDKRWSTTFALEPCTARRWRLTLTPQRKIENPVPSYVRFSSAARLDGWETLGGWVMRDLPREGTAAAHYATETGRVTLVFGHVNNKFKNAPAPAEATGWECDKLDPEGFRNHFAGYLGRLLTGPLANGKLKGFVVDSWECGRQTWTPKMAQYFREINGYELRPHLPTLFGWPAGPPADAERFLRDWRRTVSTLVEENYYRVLAETGHAHGLVVQFETAFGDVLPGDPLRYWKYADIPMCEFWLPFDNAKGSVGSDNFKPVRSCVSGAHLYGKRRVQAEAFTTVRLNWDENFRDFKALADRHFARGVTHVVCHTYTHNPQVGADFVAPGTSFGGGIGSPFVRGQTWWGFMPELTRYLARCGHMLERGKPVVDVLWYLGDALGHRPDENAPFPIGYKYDYCTYDALVTRVDVKDGRLVLPDGMSYRVLWIPSGTFLLPATERRLAALAQKGARIIRGDLKPDWPSELTKIGEWPAMWYQRRDGDEDIFFIARNSGESEFVCVKDGVRRRLDPLTGEERAAWRDAVSTAPATDFALMPCADYPPWATNRLYAASFVRPAKGAVVLDLGEVRDWAEVSVNGRAVVRLWCAPYACDLTPHLRDGSNEVRVNVTSTWYNRLVHEASLPETARTAWTLGGPKADAAPHPAGLLGPARLVFSNDIRTTDNRKDTP